MSKKSIIITNIVGVILIIAVFISITYAYYTTTIKDNFTGDDFSAKLGNVDIIYSDNNSILSASKVASGSNIGTKSFQVKSNAKTKQKYTVIFENVTNTFTNKAAIKYSITCKIAGSSNKDCPNTNLFETYFGTLWYAFPSNSSNIVTTTIEPGETHNYNLTLKYEKNAPIENKRVKAKINISATGVSSSGSNLPLADVVIRNALNCNSTNCTKFKAPDTKVGTINSTTEKELAIDNDDYGVSYYFRGNVNDNFVNFAGKCWRIVRIQGDGSTKLILEDDTTTCQNSKSTTAKPYITPMVQPNTTPRPFQASAGSLYGYSVRSSGSSSGTSSNPYLLNYTDFSFHQYTVTSGKYQVFGAKYLLDAWYNALDKNYKSQIKPENWCIGDTTKTYSYTINSQCKNIFSPYLRLNYDYDGPRATYICDGTTVSSYSGLLTLDEVIYSGIGRVNGLTCTNAHNISNYLSTDLIETNMVGHYWWLISPAMRCTGYDQVFAMPYNSNNSSSDSTSTADKFDPVVKSVAPGNGDVERDTNIHPTVRPSIVLRSGVTTSTIATTKNPGSKTNPYEVLNTYSTGI